MSLIMTRSLFLAMFNQCLDLILLYRDGLRQLSNTNFSLSSGHSLITGDLFFQSGYLGTAHLPFTLEGFFAIMNLDLSKDYLEFGDLLLEVVILMFKSVAVHIGVIEWVFQHRDLWLKVFTQLRITTIWASSALALNNSFIFGFILIFEICFLYVVKFWLQITLRSIAFL